MPENCIQTFDLESANLRGRILRMNGALDSILKPHNYPALLGELVGETCILTALLGSTLKYEGIFTLQAQGDGPVSMIVSDMTSANDVRGCASFNADDFEALKEKTLQNLLGKGYLAFTVDPGGDMERYQGIVELKGETMGQCAEFYFEQSEQIKTNIKIVVEHGDNGWQGAGLILQEMPNEDPTQIANDNAVYEDWQRNKILMDTCSDEELMDPALSLNDILYRLFHEEGVRVYEEKPLTKGCRCTDDKLTSILKTMSEEDLTYMTKDGTIEMVCEFCNKKFQFESDAI